MLHAAAMGRTAALVALSFAMHGLCFVLLGRVPEQRATIRNSVTDIELVREPKPVEEPPPQPPEPEPPEPEPPEPPEPEPPEPEPPRPRRRAPDPEPRPDPPPEEPPAAAAETPVDFTGVTLTHEGKGSWETAVGSGAPIDGPVGSPGQTTGRKREGNPRGAPGGTGQGEAEPGVISLAAASRQPSPPGGLGRALENAYPRKARQQGIEGVAVVVLRVFPSGKVGRVRKVRESADGFFAACREVLASTRWKPALDKRGEPAAVDVKFTCRFDIAD